jgi:hypothetical protein
MFSEAGGSPPYDPDLAGRVALVTGVTLDLTGGRVIV